MAIGDRTHKLNLFADDTILFISDPLTSLPHLLTVLEDFGRVAGFAVNYAKLEAYPINLTKVVCDTFHLNFKFKPVKKQWKHLGVVIPLNLDDLFKVNFDPLVNHTREHFRDWSRMSISWPERLELLKMSILPQFTLFQNLPVTISESSLANWQKDFLRFVWKNSSHRISRQFLSRPKKLGGYGLPLLENYYLAAQLRSIYTYLTSPELLGWMQIKKSYISPQSIKELIWRRG